VDVIELWLRMEVGGLNRFRRGLNRTKYELNRIKCAIWFKNVHTVIHVALT
jgi:hypothetical protein